MDGGGGGGGGGKRRFCLLLFFFFAQISTLREKVGICHKTFRAWWCWRGVQTFSTIDKTIDYCSFFWKIFWHTTDSCWRLEKDFWRFFTLKKAHNYSWNSHSFFRLRHCLLNTLAITICCFQLKFCFFNIPCANSTVTEKLQSIHVMKIDRCLYSLAKFCGSTAVENLKSGEWKLMLWWAKGL